MGVKSYRITDEQEFYREALSYINGELKVFMKKVDEQFPDRKKRRNIYRKYETYLDFDGKPNSLILKEGILTLLEDVSGWCDFSCNEKADQKEIILRIILSNIYNCDLVSTLMISSNKNLTEDFIKDCIFASSFLFKFNEWDDQHVDAVVSCAASGLPSNKCKELIELYDNERLADKPISIKFDFNDFNFAMTEDFENKFYFKDKFGKLIAKR